MKGHFVYGRLRSDRNHFRGSRIPLIIYRNPTCKELPNNNIKYSLLYLSLSLYFSHLCIFSTKNNLAKLKGLLRVQPNGRRKDEPQRGFISVRYYEV